MKKRLFFLVLFLLVVCFCFCSFSKRRIDATYEAGERAYKIFREWILEEAGSEYPILINMVYNLFEDTINLGSKYSVDFDKDGTVRYSTGFDSSVLIQEYTSDTSQYTIERDKKVYLPSIETFSTGRQTFLGYFSEDYDTFFMVLDDLNVIPLDRVK